MIFRLRSLASDADIDDFLIQSDDPEPPAQVFFQSVLPFVAPSVLPAPDTTSTAAAAPNPISPEPTLAAALGEIQPKRPSLDAGLTALAHGAAVTDPLFPVVGGLSVGHAPNSISPDGQYVTIDAIARDGDGAALLLELQAIGLQKGGSFKGMASGLLPVDQVDALLEIANLAHARESGWISRAGQVTAQADVSMRADIARSTFGFDGTGITIGILSDSFDTRADPITTMAQDIASGDLPADTVILEDDANGTDEGRAIAQIIHDIAPGASILFATANTGQANFANNIIALANAGAQVIIDDVFYFFEPTFQDGIIAQAIDQVVADGVIYFSSAGNEARAGYESPFIDGGTGTIDGIEYTFHDFGTTVDGVPSTLLQINQDDDTNYSFQWADAAVSASPGVGPMTNLDFAGYSDPEATNELFFFDNDEIAVDGEPINHLFVPDARTFYLRIGLRDGPEPVALKIVAFNNEVTYGANTTNINDGASFGHTGAAGAISVGAADVRDTPAFGTDPPVIEFFSSAGPLNIWVDAAGNILTSPQVRQTPAITAPDGVDTTFFGKDNTDPGTFPNFFGTSASAPAAAAVAALMLQARPALTASDIRNLLINSAIDMDDPATAGFDLGVDAASGAGLIQADLAVGYASTLVITATAAHPLMLGTHLADTFKGGAEDDTFTGFGDIDTLVFTPGGLADAFTDFIAGAGGDVVNLTTFPLLRSINDVLAISTQLELDTVIDFGAGDKLTLANVVRTNLLANNFVFAQAPVAFVASASGNEDAIIAGQLVATDADSPSLTYSRVTDAAHGIVLVNADGAFTYQPDPDFNGTDSFTFKANDGALDSNVATVSLTINPANDPPVIVSGGGGDSATVSVLELTTPVTTVTAADPDGPSLAFSIVGGSDADKFQIDGSTGALSFITAPSFDVRADADHNNSYIVQVRASDGTLFDDQTLTVQVTDDPNITSTVHWDHSVGIAPHPAGWVPVGQGDFNADGTTDVAWFNAATNNIDIWKLSNGAWAGSSNVGSHPPGYHPVGFSDYNGDGTDDVLWFNPTTRDVDLWKIVDGQWAGSVSIGTHPPGFQPALSGDFTGDGTSDVLWFNPTTNAVDIWKIVNGQWAGSVDNGTHPAGYQPALAGDFNGDGTDDIAWFNPTNGDVDIWKLSNGQWAGSVHTGPHPLGWKPLGAADFNLDGTDDIAWYNPTTNNIDIWLLNNGQWMESANIGSHPGAGPSSPLAVDRGDGLPPVPPVVAVGVGDFDHNGVADVMWHDTGTNRIDNWMLAFS